MEIPLVIHYIWLGNNLKSKEVKSSINTWKKHAKNFKIIEWDEEKLKKLMIDDEFYQAALEDHNYAYASDQARLEILKRYGGVYMDTDMNLLTNPLPFLKNRELVLCFQNTTNPSDEVIETSFMACVPNHPLILNLLDIYKNITYNSQRLTPNSELLGPVIFQEYELNHNKKNQIKDNGDAVFYSCERFWQPTYKSVAVHVGLKSWGKLNKRDKVRILLRKNIKNRVQAGFFQLGSNLIRVLSKIK